MNILFIGGIGATEMVLIVVVLLLLFGGKKLPELMRGAGRGIKEFKDAMNNPTPEEPKSDQTTTDETKK